MLNILKWPVDLADLHTICSSETLGFGGVKMMAVNPEIYESIRQEIVSFIIDESPNDDIIGMCEMAAQELFHRFPDFKVKSGRIIDDFGSSWNHYWCETPNGDIVDPTVEQYFAPVQYPNGEIWDPIRLEDIKIIEIQGDHYI